MIKFGHDAFLYIRDSRSFENAAGTRMSARRSGHSDRSDLAGAAGRLGEN